MRPLEDELRMSPDDEEFGLDGSKFGSWGSVPLFADDEDGVEPSGMFTGTVTVSPVSGSVT